MAMVDVRKGAVYTGSSMSSAVDSHPDFQEIDNYLMQQPEFSTQNPHLRRDPMISQYDQGAQRPVQPQSMTSEPFIRFVEQPQPRGLRFRYQCEGRCTGSILGVGSTDQRKTYPSIELVNTKGPAAVVVSCVTKDHPHRPHPHKLTGNNCKEGVCTIKLDAGTTKYEFQNLGIQCVKKKEVESSLNSRKSIQVDPYNTGYDTKDVDMSTVRLCFQAFLRASNGKFHRVISPVVSHEIFDKKIVNDLKVERLSRQAGSAAGGEEVFILCEKVNKDNIKVRFFEDNDSDMTSWESYGEFGASDVHKQVAIVFKTPKYKEVYIKERVTVKMELIRPSDNMRSEPREFTYAPPEEDVEGISAKRRKNLNAHFRQFYDDSGPPQPGIPRTVTGGVARINSQDEIRQRPRANARRVRQPKVEATTPTDPQPLAAVVNPGLENFLLENLDVSSFLGDVQAGGSQLPGNEVNDLLASFMAQPQPPPQAVYNQQQNTQYLESVSEVGEFAPAVWGVTPEGSGSFGGDQFATMPPQSYGSSSLSLELPPADPRAPH